MSAPRGRDEKIPDWNERGDGALVRVDCLSIADVPVLLPLPELMLTPLDEGKSSRTPQHDARANEANGLAFKRDARAITAPRSHLKCGSDSRVTFGQDSNTEQICANCEVHKPKSSSIDVTFG